MFDIGFWELTIIAIVALLVIGPERLPQVARTTGMWFGRMRRFVSGVKADIDREIKADELKRIMAQQEKSAGVHEILDETKSAMEELAQTQAALNEDVAGQPSDKEKPDTDNEPNPRS